MTVLFVTVDETDEEGIKGVFENFKILACVLNSKLE
jgi:hypothetical protein